MNERQFRDAKEKLEACIEQDPSNGAAYRLMARIHLEADDELQDNALALERIQKAYELGGDKDPAVLNTLAKALGANGRADHGIRYLERLYALAATDEERNPLAKQIDSYRKRFRLGDVWEFINSWGDVILESGQIEEIQRAVENGSIPKDAQCRKNRTGAWRSIEEALVPQYPQLAALYTAPKSHLVSGVVMGGLAGLAIGVLGGLFIPALAANRAAMAALPPASWCLGCWPERARAFCGTRSRSRETASKPLSRALLHVCGAVPSCISGILKAGDTGYDYVSL